VQTIVEAINAEAPGTREYLDLRLSTLEQSMRAWTEAQLGDQTWKVTATFVVVSLAATVLNHFWK
jgi:hypothetical protein